MFLAWLAAIGAFVALLWALRTSPYYADPLLDTYVEVAGSLLAFTFAANALVRFRGLHDRISLILAFGFVLAGLIEAATSMTSFRQPQSGAAALNISLGWMAGRTLLALLLVAALVIDRYMPISRNPAGEIAKATLTVGLTAYFTSVFYFSQSVLQIHVGAWLPRPWEMLPASIFLVATVGYWRRLRRAEAALDPALCIAAGLSVVCHLIMTQSQRKLDASFIASHVVMVMSYAVVLGGTLLDNAHLFDQVSRMAITDSLTGLANHRRLVEVLEFELQRSGRTGRRFSVVLLDMDGLKKINDERGHLVGSRAIKRLGNILKSNCRSVDTAARYGGDEFAVVLPESGREEALQAAERIRKRLAEDKEEPRFTVSIGLAVFPRDGTTIEKLLGAADEELYRMKGEKKGRPQAGNIAACL